MPTGSRSPHGLSLRKHHQGRESVPTAAPTACEKELEVTTTILKRSATHSRRAMKCIAIASLAAAFIVPTASARTKHDTVKISIVNVR